MGLTTKRKAREYLYTVETRAGKTPEGVTTWQVHMINATSMVEVSRLLKQKLEDLRYVTKVRL